MHHIPYRPVILLILFTAAIFCNAFVPDRSQNVHIELRYAAITGTSIVGARQNKEILPYSYYIYNDIYSNEDAKLSCETWADGVTSFDFPLNHPLYDYINHGGNVRIPFYVEPGDSLIISVTKAGRVLSYCKINGDDVKYQNLLHNDISLGTFYRETDFVSDSKDVRFPEFVRQISRQMETVVDSVRRVADRYNFSDVERRMAINNIKLQFGVWMLEYASFKSMELNSHSERHTEGWQVTPYQDETVGDLQNPLNYSFIRQMPLNDSTCLASRHFQPFIIAYEHAQIFNHDQYLYYGTSLSDQARMDSVFMAREKSITGYTRPSLMMEIAMLRRHFEAPAIDDGSIKLQEVQVIGQQQNFNKEVTVDEMNTWRLNQRPQLMEQIFSPTYWFIDRKKYKNRERAKALIKKIEEAEQREQSERDAIMKAYEEEMARRK